VALGEVMTCWSIMTRSETYTVDFYSPLRGNLHRLIIAYNYAIGFIEGAEKMRRKRSKLAEQ